MSVKKALERSYEGIRPPEDIEHRVLFRIEERRRRFWRRVALIESLLVAGLVLGYALVLFKPAQYETMGLRSEVRVEIVRDVPLSRLSEELSRFGLRIEGPYEGYFYLVGSPQAIEEFLKSNDFLLRRQ